MTEQTQIVVANAETALQWQQAIGSELETIYNQAAERQDGAAIALVNSAWEKTQALSQLAQGSIAARDQALSELAELLEALDAEDEAHPKLIDFATALRESEFDFAYEVAQNEIYEGAYYEAEEAMSDAAYEQVCQNLKDNLSEMLVRLDESVSNTDARSLADALFENIFEKVMLESTAAELLLSLARALVDQENE